MLNLQVAVPALNAELDFNDTRPWEYLSAPSTPKPVGDYFYSAPTSPGRAMQLYRFWEQDHGTPFKSIEDDGFAFDFRVELAGNASSADELFDGGKIRSMPLKPPPDTIINLRNILLSPVRHNQRITREVLPKLESDASFRTEDERGRVRVLPSSRTVGSSRRATRSLSPVRVSPYPWEEEEEEKQHMQKNKKQPTTGSTKTTTSSRRPWKLKDFFLFRSASEGRGLYKHNLLKNYYTALFRKHNKDNKNSCFRTKQISTSGSRGKEGASAHEVHYTMNRAASQELKKRTFLPYKQNILGLAFTGFGSR